LHLAWQQPKDVTNGDVILIVLQTVNRYLKDCCCLVSSLLREIFVKKKQSSFHRCVVCLLLLPLALSLGPLASFADAATVTLGWDANSEPDLEGYVIYRNTGSPGPPYDYANPLPEADLITIQKAWRAIFQMMYVSKWQAGLPGCVPIARIQ
jgi:hypothetical protein